MIPCLEAPLGVPACGLQIAPLYLGEAKKTWYTQALTQQGRKVPNKEEAASPKGLPHTALHPTLDHDAYCAIPMSVCLEIPKEGLRGAHPLPWDSSSPVDTEPGAASFPLLLLLSLGDFKQNKLCLSLVYTPQVYIPLLEGRHFTRLTPGGSNQCHNFLMISQVPRPVHLLWGNTFKLIQQDFVKHLLCVCQVRYRWTEMSSNSPGHQQLLGKQQRQHLCKSWNTGESLINNKARSLWGRGQEWHRQRPPLSGVWEKRNFSRDNKAGAPGTGGQNTK